VVRCRRKSCTVPSNPPFRRLNYAEISHGGFLHSRGRKGTARRAVVEKMVKSLGGKLETFYFAFGDNDAYVVSEGPDSITAAAISLAVSASGTVKSKTVVLLTPEEVDQASKKTIEIRPPGACESQLFRFPKRLHGFNRPGAFSSSFLSLLNCSRQCCTGRQRRALNCRSPCTRSRPQFGARVKE
jgi:uncharacterized protein with GYD domain